MGMRSIVLPAYLLLLVIVTPVATDVVEFCKDREPFLGEKGATGIIQSENWPDTYNSSPDRPDCRIWLRACPACSIQLNITDVVLPTCPSREQVIQQNCISMCDHLYIWETDYKKYTSMYVFPENESLIYTSMSNRISLQLCEHSTAPGQLKKFRITYTVLSKQFIYNKMEGAEGYIRGPNFPRGYMRNEEIYKYIIVNNDKRGSIRLTFDDWNLSPDSQLEIIRGGDGMSEKYKKEDYRPVIETVVDKITMVFRTGSDHYMSSYPYLGFKAKYQFTSDTGWDRKPKTTCGAFHRSLLGGSISLDDRKCIAHNDFMDCVWVVSRYQDYRLEHIAVIVNMSQLPEWGSLEVRKGVSSDSPLLATYREYQALSNHKFHAEEALYLRLRGSCPKFFASFASYRSYRPSVFPGPSTCFDAYHFKCKKDMCLPKELHCDGINHCGDNSDENCTATPTRACAEYFECDRGSRYFCRWDRCDGKKACLDGKDEEGCQNGAGTNNPGQMDGAHPITWSVYIPIGLACVTAAIVVCMIISFCTRRKHLMQRQRQMQQQFSRQRGDFAGDGPGNQPGIHTSTGDLFVHCQAPPSYEETMLNSPPAYSHLNLGFSHIEPIFQPLQPPPYSSPRNERRFVPVMTGTDFPPCPPPRGGQAAPGQQPQSCDPAHRPNERYDTETSQTGRTRSESTESPGQGIDNPTFEIDSPTRRPHATQNIIGTADIGMCVSTIPGGMQQLGRTNSYRSAVHRKVEQSAANVNSGSGELMPGGSKDCDHGRSIVDGAPHPNQLSPRQPCSVKPVTGSVLQQPDTETADQNGGLSTSTGPSNDAGSSFV